MCERHDPQSFGMTFVRLKKKIDYPSMTNNWSHILSRRDHLINLFWNKENIKGLQLDLVLNTPAFGAERNIARCA